VVISSFLIGACKPDPIMPAGIETQAEIVVPTDTPAPANDVKPEEPEVDLLPGSLPEGIEIEFWHPFSGETANLMDDLIGEYNVNNAWGIMVKGSAHADERLLMQDFLGLDVEETGPDLIASPSFFLQLLQENEISLVNIEDYLESPVWGFPDNKKPQFLPIFWNSDYANGERIGIPAYRSGKFLYVNQTWVNELGFSNLISGSEEFQEIVCAAAESYRNDEDPENDGLGGLVYAYDGYAILSWLKAFKGGFPRDGLEHSSFSIEENISAAGFLHDLFFKDCAWVGLQPLPYQYFSNRQGIAYSGTLEDILIQEQVNAINETLDEWTIFPYPASDGKPVVLVDGFSYAIFDNEDENKSLAAWDFIRWMLQVENQVKLVEVSGSFPLSTNAIGLLRVFADTHPVWERSLQYLPLAQTSTNSSNWLVAQDILTDISRRLIQFTTSKEDIPFLLESADTLLEEIQVQQ